MFKFEESVSSIPAIWSSMISWFTPTVLFVLLNVMIVTIAFTSRFANQKHHHHQQNPDDVPQQQQPRLAKSPSVLQRLRSINLYSYRSQEPHPSPPITTTHFNPNPDSETETHHVFQQTHFEEPPSLDEVFIQLKDHHVNRTKSDTKPASGEIPEKLPAKMRKSASAKSAFAHFEEEDIVEARRPATVKESKGRASSTEADDEQVDAKADDFINRFKQQLKLQRLDSVIRYKDMISRGGGK